MSRALSYLAPCVDAPLGELSKNAVSLLLFLSTSFRSRNALQCHPCYRQSPHFPTPSIFTNSPGISTPGFLCEICNKEFKTKQSLKVHKQAIHEGVKFNCEFCSHSATTKSNLKVHVQKKHTIAQPMYEQPLPAGAIQYI